MAKKNRGRWNKKNIKRQRQAKEDDWEITPITTIDVNDKNVQINERLFVNSELLQHLKQFLLTSSGDTEDLFLDVNPATGQIIGAGAVEGFRFPSTYGYYPFSLLVNH